MGDRRAILQRCLLIELFTAATIVPVKFEHDVHSVTRFTRRVSNRQRITYGTLTDEQVHDFLAYMDCAHALGLVHGDLNRKNVFLAADGRLCVSDWEPWLVQVIHNKTVLMGTFPWVDNDDKLLFDLTERTDYLCMRLLVLGNVNRPHVLPDAQYLNSSLSISS